MNKCVLRCFGLVAAVFAVIMVFDIIWHGFLMREMYADTTQLWRPGADMGFYLPFLLIGQLVIATMLVVVFGYGYQGRGVMEGVRYGLCIATLFLGVQLVMFAVVPYSAVMVGVWVLSEYIKFPLCGAVLAVLYKPKSA